MDISKIKNIIIIKHTNRIEFKFYNDLVDNSLNDKFFVDCLDKDFDLKMSMFYEFAKKYKFNAKISSSSIKVYSKYRKSDFILRKEIKYKDLMSPILDCFRIHRDSIENFSIKTHDINLDDTYIIQNVIEEMILIVDDLDNIVNMDDWNEFDIDSSEISEIRVVYEDETEKSYIVSMTHEDYNRGQMNRLDGNKVYISIKDESESILNDID